MNLAGWFTSPMTETVRNYSTEYVRRDLTAGLTVALLAVPQCMAYALLAELNPVYGLYAALAGVFVGALFSSSNVIVTGPTAKVSLVVGSVLVAYDPLPPVQSVVVLTLMVGVLQLLFSFLRAGNLAAFVSDSVISGFIVGGGLVIIGDQVIYLLDAAEGKSPYFVERAYRGARLLLARGEVPLLRLGLGVGTIGFILLLRWIHHRLPSGIIAIVVGGVLSAQFGFDELGVEIVGEIPRGLPDFTLPVLSPDHFLGLLSGAMALTILGSVQTISISKSIARETRETIDENQELFGQGMANLAAAFFQGYPMSASFTRSFLNQNVGAKTRVSGLIGGIGVALIVLVAAPYAYFLPIPVLGGLIIVVVADVFEWEEIRTVLTITTIDRVAFGTTFVSVLVLQLDTAIYVGVAVTLFLYLRRASNLDLKEYVLDEEGKLHYITDPAERPDERIALVDVNGEVFFGSAERIRTRVRNLLEESEELDVVILRMKNALNLDSSSMVVFKELVEELRHWDKTLIFSGITPKIREVMVESGVAELVGEDKILIAQNDLLESTRQAVDRAKNHIDDVLEGSASRTDEDPPLDHTLEQLNRDEENPQDPIKEERIDPS